MSAHVQDRSTHGQFLQSEHRQRRCAPPPPEIGGGHKLYAGIAWWPGYLPFSLDGSTLNTTKFQHVAPTTSTKYRQYRYYTTGTCVWVDVVLVTQTEEYFQEIIFVFDEDYGDLQSATYRARRTRNGVIQSDTDEEWSRAADGYYSDHAIASHVSGPDSVTWPTDAGSGNVSIYHSARAHQQAFGNFDGGNTITLPLNATTFDLAESGEYDPGPASATNGTYSFTLSLQLSAALTQTERADEAARLAVAIGTVTGAQQTVSAIVKTQYAAFSIAQWRAASAASVAHAMTEDAETLGGNATNVIGRAFNRYAVAEVNMRLDLTKPEGCVASYGIPEQTIQTGYPGYIVWIAAPSKWWDEPQMGTAIRSARSIVNLDIGLACGQTKTDGFSIWYYDFEIVTPQEAGGVVGNMTVGVHAIDPQVRVFDIPELQGQLGSLSREFGVGWLAVRMGNGSVPACP